MDKVSLCKHEDKSSDPTGKSMPLRAQWPACECSIRSANMGKPQIKQAKQVSCSGKLCIPLRDPV